MVVSVSPTLARPTHHVKLTDGVSTVGLILCDSSGNAAQRMEKQPYPASSIKTYTGEQTHSDLEPPFTSIAQQDWSGGRGGDDFDDDKTQYYDGFRADTTRAGQAILGPREVYTTGARSFDQHDPYKDIGSTAAIATEWTGLYSTSRYLAMRFVSTGGARVKLYVTVRVKGTPTDSLKFDLLNDSSGSPGTVITSTSFTVASANGIATCTAELAIPSQTLVASTAYWISLYGGASDTVTNHWQVLCEDVDVGGSGQKSANGSSWSDAGSEILFRLVDAAKDFKAFFFTYKEALWCAIAYDDGSASKLFINGYQGISSGAGGAATLTVAGTPWTANEWRGCTVALTVGTGANAPTRHRLIPTNTNNTLTITPNWDTIPNGTEFVILGSDKWTEATGHGMTGRVTDILSHWYIAYLAMGDGEDLKRMRWYNSAGTWTAEYVTETGNKAAFLLAAPDKEGAIKVWKANRDFPAQVAKATSVWGGGSGTVANLSFGSGISVGDTMERNTGLEVYGEPLTLWVFKEGSVHSMEEDKPIEVPLREMRVVGSETNGAAHLVHNLYLYFSLLQSWQRYYKSNLDDQGLTSGPGLPSNRQGVVSHAVGYPGRYYVAIDGGYSNYSSVLCWNGFGFHEIYRAPRTGMRIRRLHIQPIPGDSVDRLWISQGSDIVWIPIELNPYASHDESYGNSYRYTHESHIQTAWFYVGLQDIPKLFNSLKMVGENFGATAWIEVDYRLDDTTAWTTLSSNFTSSGQKIDFSSTYAANGKRIQLRIRLLSMSNRTTPKLVAGVMEAITRVPYKYRYTGMVRMGDRDRDLNGDPDDIVTANSKLSILEAWAGTTTPVTLSGIENYYHNKTVLVDASPVHNLRKVIIEGREYQLCQLNLLGV